MSEKLRSAVAAAREDERRKMLGAIDVVERNFLPNDQEGAGLLQILRESIEARSMELRRRSGVPEQMERVREYAVHARRHADEVDELLGAPGRSAVYRQLAEDMEEVVLLLGLEPLEKRSKT